MSTLLFERGPIRVLNHSSPTQEIITQLESTAYGTEGLAYLHGNVKEKILALPGPNFVTLKKKDQLMGTVALSERDTTVENLAQHSYYIRYFSFLESMRRPNTRQPERQPSRSGNRMLKPLLWSLFDRSDLMDAKAPPKSTLYYAYVESENQRSYEMCMSFGFEPLRTMTTIPFSRAYPKADLSLRKAKPEEQAWLLSKMKEYYRGYSMVTFETVFAGNHYWVWEEKGEILGGLQAYPITWKFQALPGATGWATMNIVPHLPILGRLFNPKKYQFAAIEGLWTQPGREDLLAPMLESALALSSITVAMMFVDKESSIYEAVKSIQRLGLMHSLNGEVDSEIIGRFVDTEEEKRSKYLKVPAYISAFDCT
ncbi:MAG: hypothetical protein AAFQ98_18930 [Bacteroidota bacterium]